MNKVSGIPSSVVTDIEFLFKDLSDKMQQKAKEYSRNNDAFHNFNQGTQRTGEDPRLILYGMMLKHLISIDDIFADLRKGIETPMSVVDEKVGDAIIYFALFHTMSKSIARDRSEKLPF